MDDFEDALNKIYPRHPTQEYVSHDEITALRARLEAVEKERDNETIKRASWELEAKIAQAALAAFDKGGKDE